MDTAKVLDGKEIQDTKENEKLNEKQKRTKKEKWQSVFKWCLPSLATLLILCFVMILNGVWPFDGNLVGYIDYSAGLVPAYNHLWDVLHGQASVFADWNLGGGSNAWASWAYFLFSPIDWLVGLFPRELVAYAISFVVIIKLCLMAFTSYWLFKKLFKNTNTYVLAIFAVLWAFSGWTMIHYTNVGWLDIMILLPVFVWATKHLKDTGKIWPFVLVLTLMLLLSYYISYMALLGLVVCSAVYVFTACEKGQRKKLLSNLFFGVIISVMLSAVIFVPSCLTSLGAHRFSSDGTSAASVSYFTNFFSKFALLLFYSLPIYFFLKLFTKLKRSKTVLWFVVSLGICLLGLVIEPINMMWHTGSYYCFPYRYAFVMLFLLSLGALYYINNFCKKDSFLKDENPKFFKLDKVLKYIFFIAIAILFVFMCFFESQTGDHPYRTIAVTNWLGYFALCALGLMLIFLALKTNTKTWVSILLVVLVCFGQVLCYNIKYMGNKLEEQNFEIENAKEIDVKGLDANYRLKDKDDLYIANLPLISKIPALETWIHISSENQWQTHHGLGYATESTILKDQGGTLFSDMILGVKYVMSEDELNSNLYTKLDEWDYKYNANTSANPDIKTKKVFLYQTKLNLPYLFSFSSNDPQLFKDFDSSLNPFEIQNQIYKSMFSKTEDILKTPVADVTQEEDETYSIKLLNTTFSNFYMYGNAESVTLDGKEINLHNGIVDLKPSGGNVIIKVKTKDVSALKFAKIEISQLENFVLSITKNAQSFGAKGRTLSINFENTNQDKYLFVPVTHLNSFTAKVNGKDAEVLKTLNGFLAVKIENGANKIEITFTPANLKLGAIISLVGLVLFLAFFFLNKKFKLSEKKTIIWIGFVGAILIFLVVVFLVYARPLLRFLTNTF